MSSQTKRSGIQGSTEFKESGVDWLGQVPSHWQVNRLRYSIESVIPGIWGSDPQGDTSDITVVRVADFDRPHLRVGNEILTVRSIRTSERQTRLLRPGDLLIEKSGGTAANPVGFVAMYEGPAETSVYANFVARMRPAQGQVPRYWLYAHAASYATRLTARSVKQTTGIQNLDQRSYFDELFPFPPASEQQAIADYLDRETQRIDELIAAQRGLIEALRERKIALAEKVFGAHVGRASRLRWYLKDVDERAGALASELPLLSVSIDWGVRRRRIGGSKQAEGDVTKYKVARHGDIVLNRMRAFQGALGVATEDGVVSPDYSVIRTSENVHSTWLASVMRAPSFIGEMVSRIRGIGGVDSGVVRTPRLNFADLREIRVVVPDLNQQCAAVATSIEQTSRINALIAESEDLIALSQERRAALITAAVTGQIDVRTAA